MKRCAVFFLLSLSSIPSQTVVCVCVGTSIRNVGRREKNNSHKNSVINQVLLQQTEKDDEHPTTTFIFSRKISIQFQTGEFVLFGLHEGRAEKKTHPIQTDFMLSNISTFCVTLVPNFHKSCEMNDDAENIETKIN